MDILLINLPTEGEVEDYSTPSYLINDFLKYPPLGLMAIASEVDAQHNVRIIDVYNQDMTIDEVVEEIVVSKPGILGIYTVTRRLYSFHEITRRIKMAFPEIIIVAGGPHINIFPAETMGLGNIDYVLCGFGEKKFPLLIEYISTGAQIENIKRIPGLYFRLNGNMEHNIRVEEPINLDEFAVPRRELIDLDDYYTAADNEPITTMYSSRGCVYKCIYCDIQEKKLHFRSPVKVVDEMEEILTNGIKQIHFFDDNFNFSRKRVIDVCNEIIKRKLKLKWTARCRVTPFDHEMAEIMKRSGCIRLHVGVESLAPEVLEIIKKNISLDDIYSFFHICKKSKIDTLAYFMIGFPDETDEYRQTLLGQIRKKLDPTYIYINIVAPLPNTEYNNMLIQQGVFKKDFWKEFVLNPVKDSEIPFPGSRKELEILKKLVYRYHKEFFLAPRFILRETVRALSSPKSLLNKSKTALNLIKTKKYL